MIYFFVLLGLWLAFTRNLFHNCNFAYSDYWHAGSKRKTTNTNFRMVSRQVDLFRHMADCFSLRYDILQLSHIVYGIRRKWSPIILIIGRALIRGDGNITNFDRRDRINLVLSIFWSSDVTIISKTTRKVSVFYIQK